MNAKTTTPASSVDQLASAASAAGVHIGKEDRKAAKKFAEQMQSTIEKKAAKQAMKAALKQMKKVRAKERKNAGFFAGLAMDAEDFVSNNPWMAIGGAVVIGGVIASNLNTGKVTTGSISAPKYAE